MDPKKLNPCEYEIYCKLVEWAETDCWCCTATRGLLVGIVAGITLGLLVGGHAAGALWFLIISAPLTIAALVWARKAWADEEEPK